MIVANELLDHDTRDSTPDESVQIHADFEDLKQATLLQGEVFDRIRVQSKLITTVFWAALYSGIFYAIMGQYSFFHHLIVIAIMAVFFEFVGYKYPVGSWYSQLLIYLYRPVRLHVEYMVLTRLLALTRQSSAALVHSGHISQLKHETTMIELSRFGI